jgi:hypothetical protein
VSRASAPCDVTKVTQLVTSRYTPSQICHLTPRRCDTAGRVALCRVLSQNGSPTATNASIKSTCDFTTTDSWHSFGEARGVEVCMCACARAREMMQHSLGVLPDRARPEPGLALSQSSVFRSQSLVSFCTLSSLSTLSSD